MQGLSDDERFVNMLKTDNSAKQVKTRSIRTQTASLMPYPVFTMVRLLTSVVPTLWILSVNTCPLRTLVPTRSSRSRSSRQKT